MAEGANFLRVHPIEEALLAAVAPSPHVAIICQGNCMVLAHRNIRHRVF